MKRLHRIFAYVMGWALFIYLFTRLLNLVNASSDVALFLGLGGIAGLVFLGTEFWHYIIVRETKGEAI